MISNRVFLKVFVAVAIGILWFGLVTAFLMFSNSQLGGCKNALEMEIANGECSKPSLLFLASIILPYLLSIFVIIREKK
ncbi:MAG: hypothetical protein ABJP02_13150 [Parasphingorhabdus sp.]|uniref:hypothetical protein n=1 Tax=Parasphingorhabdus sp. TaxID=2709688 RepID=UPI00329A7A84